MRTPFHEGEINHQAVIATTQAGSVVTTATYGREQLLVATESHGGNHIRHIGAARDQQRPLVDHGIVQLPACS